MNFPSGLNRTKIGLKYDRDEHTDDDMVCLNRTKIGLKFLMIVPIILYNYPCLNRTKIGLK